MPLGKIFRHYRKALFSRWGNVASNSYIYFLVQRIFSVGEFCTLKNETGSTKAEINPDW